VILSDESLNQFRQLARIKAIQANKARLKARRVNSASKLQHVRLTMSTEKKTERVSSRIKPTCQRSGDRQLLVIPGTSVIPGLLERSVVNAKEDMLLTTVVSGA
jgi:flagellar basal body rod protein FlgF